MYGEDVVSLHNERVDLPIIKNYQRHRRNGNAIVVKFVDAAVKYRRRFSRYTDNVKARRSRFKNVSIWFEARKLCNEHSTVDSLHELDSNLGNYNEVFFSRGKNFIIRAFGVFFCTNSSKFSRSVYL